MTEVDETILNLWDRGQTSYRIGHDLNIRNEYVRVIVQRARAKGDKRAHRRPNGPAWNFRLNLPRDVMQALGREADIRDMSDREIANKIICMAMRCNLVKAILDDDAESA